MQQKPSAIIYIHGFNSSPLSQKATALKAYCEQSHPNISFITPRLPVYPKEAADFLLALIDDLKQTHRIFLVGSSMGGYFSLWLHNQFGFPAVVINPAIKPYELLLEHLGEQVNPYTQERYWLEKKHTAELKALDLGKPKYPERIWLLQQKGDEILDHRIAVKRLNDCKQTVEEGGDHSFTHFSRYFADILNFFAQS